MKFKSQSLLLLKLDFLAFFSILYRVLSILLVLCLFFVININLLYNIKIFPNNYYLELFHFFFYFLIIFHIFYGRLKFLLIFDKILIFVSNNLINIKKLYSIMFVLILLFSFIMYMLNFLYITCLVSSIQELFDINKIFNDMVISLWLSQTNIQIYLFCVLFLVFFYIKCQLFSFNCKEATLFLWESFFLFYYSWLPLKKMLSAKYIEIFENKNFYTVFMWKESNFNKILLNRSIFAKWFQLMNIADHNFKDPLYIVVLDSYIYFLERCSRIYSIYILQELLKKF